MTSLAALLERLDLDLALGGGHSDGRSQIRGTASSSPVRSERRVALATTDS